MRTHNQTEVSRVKRCHMDYDQEDGCPMCIAERRALDLAERLAAAEARAEKAISDTVQEFGLRRAAESRVGALEKALRHATRELQYITDAGPCSQSDQHISGETFACIRLAESLLGPMREWPEEPNATQATGFRVWKVAARIAPPPEAEKKGDNDGR